MHKHTFHELENKAKRDDFSAYSSGLSRGEAESGRKWGVGGTLRQNRCFAADSPLASVHIIYLFLSIFLLVMAELQQWQVGPLSGKEATLRIPPLNPPSQFCSYEMLT